MFAKSLKKNVGFRVGILPAISRHIHRPQHKYVSTLCGVKTSLGISSLLRYPAILAVGTTYGHILVVLFIIAEVDGYCEYVESIHAGVEIKNICQKFNLTVTYRRSLSLSTIQIPGNQHAYGSSAVVRTITNISTRAQTSRPGALCSQLGYRRVAKVKSRERM